VSTHTNGLTGYIREPHEGVHHRGCNVSLCGSFIDKKSTLIEKKESDYYDDIESMLSEKKRECKRIAVKICG
jgi:hypothetical protein